MDVRFPVTKNDEVNLRSVESGERLVELDLVLFDARRDPGSL